MYSITNVQKLWIQSSQVVFQSRRISIGTYTKRYLSKHYFSPHYLLVRTVYPSKTFTHTDTKNTELRTCNCCSTEILQRTRFRVCLAHEQVLSISGSVWWLSNLHGHFNTSLGCLSPIFNLRDINRHPITNRKYAANLWLLHYELSQKIFKSSIHNTICSFNQRNICMHIDIIASKFILSISCYGSKYSRDRVFQFIYN